MELEIIYQDEHIIAVNKPNGLITHNTSLARDAETSALYVLKNQIDQFLFTIHRLDRKTSGVLLFALSKECQSEMSALFREGKVKKYYKAIVRGYTEPSGTIDYAITNLKSVLKDAVSHYETIEHFELPLAFGNHNTSRYSLVQLMPQTGRYHQLRKHMAHIFHPIIGDRPHGCNKQNKMFKERFNMDKMLLHADKIEFIHPMTKEPVSISCDYPLVFKGILDMMHKNNLDIKKVIT